MEAAFQAGIAQASLQVLLERITDFAVKETSLILGVDDEIRRLQRTLQRIRAILDIVGNNQQSLLKHSSTEAWKMWAADLEKHSYSAEDLLDEISLDLLQVGADHLNEANESYQVRNMLLSSFKLSMPHEIGKIRKELEDIATEMDSLVLTKITSSLVDEGFVVGREKDKDEIVKMLLTANANRSNVSVIPLVGMGGIGKTTLAQIVYNDNRVVKNFDLRVWISVSVNFDVIGITKSIIESLTGKKCKLSDLDPIQCKLQSLLSGRKFLLVLDDYWTEKYGDWDSLTCPFRVGLRGSKVVVTTRSSVVASILGTFPAYHLKVLNDKDCWELMKQRAFSNKDPEENMNMEEMGRKIAKKCRGLPLAAQSLGGMLHFQFDEEEWECILNSELWDLPQEKNDIFSSLLISYHFLPSHLKKCFAYCSIFPRNHEFERDKLVLLWMAEGFIQPRGGKRLEDVGTNLKKLTNLRHLDLDIKHQLNYMPSDLGNLVNLQTMNAFIVGKGKGCGIGQLGNMRFLRGSICITNLENVLSVMEANEANLCMKPFLESLHWLGDPLLKLRTIHIRSCQYCSVLPSLGQLPLLKHLCIENLSSLASIDDHFCGFGPTKGFPSLELLIFQNMPNLMEWKGLDGQDMPLLRELTFINCPRLTSLPSLHNLSFLHNLNISHCPKLQALPEQGLPVSLQILIILESAIIKERCRVEEGEDWSVGTELHKGKHDSSLTIMTENRETSGTLAFRGSRSDIMKCYLQALKPLSTLKLCVKSSSCFTVNSSIQLC
ncbi:unnamed protein product [Coffea canephora]|uniref:NB-ARC domain-containing protein n=1 Tax=Coffea canephora TaxID=49390 RepID=A0A068V8Q9_COFCA|nr:unnamed protein product [Coffea canephora]